MKIVATSVGMFLPLFSTVLAARPDLVNIFGCHCNRTYITRFTCVCNVFWLDVALFSRSDRLFRLEINALYSHTNSMSVQQ